MAGKLDLYDIAFAEINGPLKLKYEDVLKNFIDFQLDNHRKIILITSGGTTVPLEKNTVRFLDNFSAGTRGSASAEYFLDNENYAVIFLSRTGSLQPFVRRLPSEHLLDVFEFRSNDDLSIKPEYRDAIVSTFRQYQRVKDQRRLLKISFISVHEYLCLLKIICENLEQVGNELLVYLAAAVADFFIPSKQLPEHKLQSDGGALNIKMDVVPKLIQPIVINSVPKAFVVSFKLETDKTMLLGKAKNALKKYGHQLVIANLLQERKHEVCFVTNESEPEYIRVTKDSNKEIEEYIVKNLSNKFDQFALH